MKTCAEGLHSLTYGSQLWELGGMSWANSGKWRESFSSIPLFFWLYYSTRHRLYCNIVMNTKVSKLTNPFHLCVCVYSLCYRIPSLFAPCFTQPRSSPVFFILFYLSSPVSSSVYLHGLFQSGSRCCCWNEYLGPERQTGFGHCLKNARCIDLNSTAKHTRGWTEEMVIKFNQFKLIGGKKASLAWKINILN